MKNPQIETHKALAQSLQDRTLEVAMYDLNISNYELSLAALAEDYPIGFNDTEEGKNDAEYKVRLEKLLKDTRRERNIAYRMLQVVQLQVDTLGIDVDAMLALVEQG
jgi:hypothetical protein